MHEFALFDLLLAPLARFLRAGEGPALQSATGRNLAAMGERISAGMEPVHSLVLACLFADLSLRGMPHGERLDLLAELRMRGFARGDTERMRLVLEALPHMITPSRRTRRLIQRPYFDEARAVFDMVAPACGGDPEAWLEGREAEQRRVEPREPGPGGGGRRRRRGRRGGRSRYRRRDVAAAHAHGASHNGETRSHGEGEPTAAARHAEAADLAGVPGPSEQPSGSLDPSNRPRG